MALHPARQAPVLLSTTLATQGTGLTLRIPLPEISRSEDGGHEYPFQIDLQTRQFMQGATFYIALADVAAGEKFRDPDGVDAVNQRFREKGASEELLKSCWDNLIRYQEFFVHGVRQNVVIMLRSHWDWYVRRLGGFVAFALASEGSHADTKALRSIGFNLIEDQLKLLESAASLDLTPDDATMDLIREMSLVRNLGLHNRWEADQYYLDNSNSPAVELGAVRVAEQPELDRWHEALQALLSTTTAPMSDRFRGAPRYGG